MNFSRFALNVILTKKALTKRIIYITVAMTKYFIVILMFYCD